MWDAGAKLKRRIQRESSSANELRDVAIRRVIVSIPVGKVSTYGHVAAAAGYPLYHRAVARLLRTEPADSLPWHRVVGAGGVIKTGEEQRLRLVMEGVVFRGDKVDMDACEHAFRVWELE